ncbi:Metal tolerance protein 1 [Nymphaea thermarum]|nr:Metal tolerance protein 1 [Nymphaea thermarum]
MNILSSFMLQSGMVPRLYSDVCWDPHHHTDAAHLLSDVVAFGISLWASGWEATHRRSYGFLRVEILVTLVSIQLISASWFMRP